MSKQELFRSAIAEAKELKDISMAQAKAQIAEAFAPRISEMFKLKVDELEENLEEEMGKESMEENMDEVNETSLDEILAELEEEGNEEPIKEDDNLEEEGYDAGKQVPEIEEAKDEEEAEDKEAEAEEAEDDVDADLDADAEMGEEGAEEVAELSIDEFKELVRQVVADVMAGHGEPDADNLDGDAAGLDMGADMDVAGADDSISLDEILAELEQEGALKEADEKVEEGKDKMEEELEEAVSTIEELKATINEMNLFNAKLLYTNKIFEAKSLNNSQKAKVLSAFDKAGTLNEVKSVYKTLTTTLDANTKTTIKESLGFASKPMGNAPVKPIVEADAIVNRFQQLAGIKKIN
jgi:flagellar biosynthesis/type III secretory pathway chaperone